jgi:hypothetical protein
VIEREPYWRAYLHRDQDPRPQVCCNLFNSHQKGQIEHHYAENFYELEVNLSLGFEHFFSDGIKQHRNYREDVLVQVKILVQLAR